jgi:hypothetical protein
MFFQNLGHCVYATKRKTDSYRVFSVFLLTTQATHIYDYEKVIQENGVPRLASHQWPRMYGSNHGSFWLTKLTIPWSQRVFKPVVLVKKEKADGTVYTVVESPMNSLQHYGLPLYPKYHDWEKRLFIPATEFDLGRGEKAQMFI